MKINKDHLYHGAAIMQIAEDEKHFKAINPLMINGVKSRTALMVNNNIAIYPKYAVKANGKLKEFIFTFKPENIAELRKLQTAHHKTFVILVCVGAQEICCLTAKEFLKLHQSWSKEVNDEDKQFQVIVTAPKRKELRVYVNAPGTRNRMLDDPFLRARSDFPGMLFR